MEELKNDTFTIKGEIGIVEELVDVALGLSVEAMQHVEIALSECNDRHQHRFDEQLQRLREERRRKANMTASLEKPDNMHHNQNASIRPNEPGNNPTPAKKAAKAHLKANAHNAGKQHGVDYPVFAKGTGVTEEHVKAMYRFLTTRGWIGTQTPWRDFQMLFSGKANDCEITWTGCDVRGNGEPVRLGKAALYALFSKMVDEGLVTTVHGEKVGPILESHFVDSERRFLTNVSSVKKASGRAREVIQMVMELLWTRPTKENIREFLQEELRSHER